MTTGRRVEWPTLALLAACYALWALGTTVVAAWWLPAGIVLAALMAALHSSLTHEVIHGHPFRNPRWNAALVWPPLVLAIPFERFRDTHLAHHMDAVLTDPYDDPESNYLDPGCLGGAAALDAGGAEPQQHAGGAAPDRAARGAGGLHGGRLAGGAGGGRAGGARLAPAPAGAGGGDPVDRPRVGHAALGLSGRGLHGAVDPEDPHLPRAPGA
jgi:hypothetical protein